MIWAWDAFGIEYKSLTGIKFYITKSDLRKYELKDWVECLRQAGIDSKDIEKFIQSVKEKM